MAVSTQFGNKVAFCLYMASTLVNPTRGVWTKVPLDTADFDIGSGADLGNNRFVAPLTGWYWLMGLAVLPECTSGHCALYVNGTAAVYSGGYYGGSYNIPFYPLACMPLYLTAGDQVELYFYYGAGTTKNLTGGVEYTRLEGFYLGK